MMNTTMRVHPNADKPHARFCEGEVAAATPMSGSLHHKRMVKIVGVLGVSLVSTGWGDVLFTNTWSSAAAPGGNTPLTAYDWYATENWSASQPVPSAYGATALIYNATTSPRWISLGDAVKVSCFNAEGTSTKGCSGNYFLGDLWAGAIPNQIRSIISLSDGYLFGNHYQTGSNGAFGYVNGDIAGRLSGKEKDVSGVTANSSWSVVGTLNMRCDLFADDANAERGNPIDATGYSFTQGGFFLYGPKGAAAQDASFDLTAGSPYLRYVGDGSHGIVPGSVVTGDGIPPNAFVRHVFATTGWIALSQPVQAGVSGTKTLHFGAITPSVTTTFSHLPINMSTSLGAYKYREEDGCKLYIKDLQVASNVDNCNVKLGVDASKNFIPGDIVLKSITDSKTKVNQYINLLNVRLIFESSYATPARPYFTQEAGYTARMTVNDGIATTLSTFRNLNGTLEKRGAGSLTLGMDSASNAGTLVVTAGTLTLGKSATLTGSDVSFARIEVAEGATLVIAAGCAVSCTTLEAAEGSVISGAGSLRVTGSVSGHPSVTGGVTIGLANTRDDILSYGTVWLDLDATSFGTAAMTTHVEGGTNFVSQWFDANGSGRSGKQRNTAKVGNATFPLGGGEPFVRENAYNGKPYVDFGPYAHNVRTVSAAVAGGVDRSLLLYDESGVAYKTGDDSTTGASRPTIKAAFLALGTEYGGGPVFGSSDSNFATYGLPHNSATPDSAPMICYQNNDYETLTPNYASFARAKIDAGTSVFRVNGVTKYPLEEGFSRGFDVFTLVSPSKQFSFGQIGYFGTGGVNYEKAAGGFLLGELLAYTTTLTATQREKVEAYLRYKWRGERIAGSYWDVETLNVPAGATVEGLLTQADTAGGEGTVKGDLDVTEGLTAVARADGTFAPLTVTGTLILHESATLRLDASAAPDGKCAVGTYDIVTADKIQTADTRWQVVGPRKRQYSVRIVGNVVRLTVDLNGTVIFLK